MTTVNFWTYCGQNLAGLCLFTDDTGIKKSVVKTLLNIFLTAEIEWPNMLTILKSKIFYDKKTVAYLSFIKIIGFLLLTVRFFKSSDQTIIQIIWKNKSILMFLINPSDCFTGMYPKPSEHLRWRSLKLLLCSLPPLTNATKNSILVVAGVLHLPLELYKVL